MQFSQNASSHKEPFLWYFFCALRYHVSTINDDEKWFSTFSNNGWHYLLSSYFNRVNNFRKFIFVIEKTYKYFPVVLQERFLMRHPVYWDFGHINYFILRYSASAMKISTKLPLSVETADHLIKMNCFHYRVPFPRILSWNEICFVSCWPCGPNHHIYRNIF